MAYNPSTKLPSLPPTPVIIVNNETGTPLDMTAVSSASGWQTVRFSGQIPVGVTSTPLLPSNTARRYFYVINHSETTVYLQFGGPAALNTGIKLSRGAVLSMSGYELFLGEINAISIQSIMIDVLEGI